MTLERSALGVTTVLTGAIALTAAELLDCFGVAAFVAIILDG